MRPETSPSVKFTYEDFVKFPDDGKRHEIIDGEHYVTPSPNTKHQRIVSRLTASLGGYLDHHPIGEVFVAPFDVVFPIQTLRRTGVLDRRSRIGNHKSLPAC